MRYAVLSARKPLTMTLYCRIEETLLYWYWVSQENNPSCRPRNCLKIIPADSLGNIFGWLFGDYIKLINNVIYSVFG